MGAGTNTVDSNATGLSIAEEVLGTPTVLPGTPVWYPLEPNSYGDFGGKVKTAKREPISADRQNRKGAVVGLDVDAKINFDWTSKAPYLMMQGFMFATWREKDNLVPTAVSGTQYTVASGGAAFVAGTLLFAEGHNLAANNGLKAVTASTGTTISAAGLSAETPGSNALVTRVGFQAAASDLSVTVVGGLAQLNATAKDLSTLGAVPGEWLYVGGDLAAYQFATATVNGFYRVKSVASTAIVFDRWPGDSTGAPVADTGTGKTVQVFLGHVIKNEATQSLQRFRTYTLERAIGANRYQYESGCGANSLKLTVKANEKVSAEVNFVGMKESTSSTAATGTRVTPLGEVVFNAASSFSRLRLLGADGQTPFVALLTDFTLDVVNGIVGVEGITNNIGKIDLTAGNFMVSGTAEAYFSSLSAVDAVKVNPDVSIDFAMVENLNGYAVGWLFDVPLLMLGDARLKVEKDKPIKLPLSVEAARHPTLNHTLLAMRFAYLPQLAI